MRNNNWKWLSLRLSLAIILTGLFFNANCHGHEGRPVYIEINQQQNALYSLRWKIPPVMPSGSEPSITLMGNGCQQLSPKFRPSLNGQTKFQCAFENESENGQHSNSALKVKIHYPNNNPVLSSLIQLTKLSGESFSLFNGPDILNITLPKKVSFLQVSQQYIAAGLFHILEGYDHLLFVLCLMQIAGGLKRLLLTISGFTLAHSITLALASLEIISIRTDLVEVLIALSIVMLAVEMAKSSRGSLSRNSPSKVNVSKSLIWQYPATVASLFGLLHGLGFASALGDLGLPQTMKLPALVFFNMGVELGQILFIAAILMLTLLAKKVLGYVKEPVQIQTNKLSNVINHVSANQYTQFPIMFIYAIGAVSGYWFVQRSLSLFI